MNRSTLTRAASLISVCVLGLTGCYLPGGNGFSNGTHTFPSSSWEPKTVTLVDTRTGQSLWSVDIPVGKQLALRFRTNDAMKGTPTPDMMDWEIMPGGEMFGDLTNSLAVPGAGDRRLDWKLRPAPELPPGMAGAEVPTATDVQ